MKKEQQLEQAYDKYSDDIFRYCYYRLYFNREKAKEMMQETYIKTWDYISDGNDIDNIRAFLYKTAKNLIIDYHRKRKEDSLDNFLEEGVQFASKSEKLDKKLDAEKYKQMIEQLDDKYQEVIMLRYIEELKPKEIAEIIDETPNVVSVRIHRGLEKLRQIIE